MPQLIPSVGKRMAQATIAVRHAAEGDRNAIPIGTMSATMAAVTKTIKLKFNAPPLIVRQPAKPFSFHSVPQCDLTLRNSKQSTHILGVSVVGTCFNIDL